MAFSIDYKTCAWKGRLKRLECILDERKEAPPAHNSDATRERHVSTIPKLTWSDVIAKI